MEQQQQQQHQQQHHNGLNFNRGPNPDHIPSPRPAWASGPRPGPVPYVEGGRNHFYRFHPYNPRHSSYDGPGFNFHQFGPRGRGEFRPRGGEGFGPRGGGGFGPRGGEGFGPRGGEGFGPRGGGFGPRGHMMNNGPGFPNCPRFVQEQQQLPLPPYNRPPLAPEGFHRFQRPPYIHPNFRPHYPGPANSNMQQFPPYGDENIYSKNNVNYVDEESCYAPQFLPPQFHGLHSYNAQGPPDSCTAAVEPYIPQRINHFPILQLYNKIEGPKAPLPSAPAVTAVEDPPYVPQPVPRDMNRIITGYTKSKRESTGSVSKASSVGEAAADADEDDEESEPEPVFQMEAKEFQSVIQNFLLSKAAEARNRKDCDENANQSISYTPTRKIELKQEPQEDNTIDQKPKTTPVKTTEENGIAPGASAPPPVLTPHRLTKTKSGFFCDDEGFVDVYIYGWLAGACNKAAYGIYFSDGNALNCAKRLSKGLQSGKGAIIRAAKEAIMLLRQNEHFKNKIRINTDSTFLYQSVRSWAVKVLNSGPNAPFAASNWDEFKYMNEIRQLCDQFVEVTVKWNLVDPSAFGIKKAKHLAISQFETSTMPTFESHIKNFESFEEFCS